MDGCLAVGCSNECLLNVVFCFLSKAQSLATTSWHVSAVCTSTGLLDYGGPVRPAARGQGRPNHDSHSGIRAGGRALVSLSLSLSHRGRKKPTGLECLVLSSLLSQQRSPLQSLAMLLPNNVGRPLVLCKEARCFCNTPPMQTGQRHHAREPNSKSSTDVTNITKDNF